MKIDFRIEWNFYCFSSNARICCGLLLCGFLGGIAAFGEQAAALQGPKLAPQPREMRLGESFPLRSMVIDVPGGDAEDFFTAQCLTKALAKRGIAISPAMGSTDITMELLRADSAEAKRLLAREKLTFDAAMHDEGYVLVSRAGSVAVIGETAAGVFYGAQTLRQMIANGGDARRIWNGTIRDWPAMKYRGVHDDLSRGPFPTLAFQEHQLEIFAEHKINLYSPYFEHTLQYSSDPLAAPPGSSLTRAEAQELAAFARRLHIIVVPEQEAFGHLHYLLQYEKYSDLAETPHGHVIAPGQPGSQPLIKSWFTQIATDFPSPFLHIGADETFELGTGRTKEEVDKRGLGAVYADFLTTIHGSLAPLNRRLLFWGDVAWNDPAAVERIPKDMIAIPWIYWHEDSYDPNILPSRRPASRPGLHRETRTGGWSIPSAERRSITFQDSWNRASGWEALAN